MLKFFLGVDPGSSGSIAVLDVNGDIVDCCALKNTDGDVTEFVRTVTERATCVATLESVHSMPRQGVKSTFTFGANYGFVRGVLTAFAVPVTLVSPAKWQGEMQCKSGGDKNVTKAAAQRIWTSFRITHANADALLIAEYGRRIYWRSHAHQ